MTGWGHHMDELAAATASLLQANTVRTSPMSDTRGALASRDALVSTLRALVGSISGTPGVAPLEPVTAYDIINRPGQALHQALAGLPRAGGFGDKHPDFYLEKNLPPYEQFWRDAARTCLGLEAYVGAMGRVPDVHSWSVLRDLADIAAALPALDHGLSETILPFLKGGEDLAVPYAMLTHAGHDTVRVCTTEIRARIPADPVSTGVPAAPEAVLGDGELNRAMDAYVRTVLDRGRDLSVGDMRAVTRLLESGGACAAQVLDRTAKVVPGAGDAAAALRQVGPLAKELRDSPAKSMGVERLDMLRHSDDLQRRVRALAAQEHQLPSPASDTDLRRLAGPALEFARHVPNLTRALEVAVRESLADGLMLIPSTPDKRNTSDLLWVTDSMRTPSWKAGPPKVLAAAQTLARAGEQVGPGVREAQFDLGRHQQAAEPARAAAAAARAHVGAARAQLREVLAQQQLHQPAPLSAALPSHPRLAPERPLPGRGR